MQANAVVKAATYWNLDQKVRLLCFDTCSANTGIRNGCCVYIEKLLNRKMIWTACRHHILERIAACAFETALKDTSRSPDIELFVNFRKNFDKIDKSKFLPGTSGKFILQMFPLRQRKEMVDFLKLQLNMNHERHDYKDLAIICLIFLGKFREFV